MTDEVAGKSALFTDKMMVFLEIRVKPRRLTARAKRFHQPKIIEQPQRPVDRIERERWQTISDALKDPVNIRMIIRLSYFPENLHPLMGQFNTGITTNLLKASHPLFDFFRVDLHNEFFCKNDSYLHSSPEHGKSQGLFRC